MLLKLCITWYKRWSNFTASSSCESFKRGSFCIDPRHWFSPHSVILECHGSCCGFSLSPPKRRRDDLWQTSVFAVGSRFSWVGDARRVVEIPKEGSRSGNEPVASGLSLLSSLWRQGNKPLCMYYKTHTIGIDICVRALLRGFLFSEPLCRFWFSKRPMYRKPWVGLRPVFRLT